MPELTPDELNKRLGFANTRCATIHSAMTTCDLRQRQIRGWMQAISIASLAVAPGVILLAVPLGTTATIIGALVAGVASTVCSGLSVVGLAKGWDGQLTASLQVLGACRDKLTEAKSSLNRIAGVKDKALLERAERVLKGFTEIEKQVDHVAFAKWMQMHAQQIALREYATVVCSGCSQSYDVDAGRKEMSVAEVKRAARLFEAGKLDVCGSCAWEVAT